LDIRERILAAMTGGEPDRVPLTVYEFMMPRGYNERRLREQGVGLIVRMPGSRLSHRQVEFIHHEYWENGERRIRRTLRTPVGEVWQTLAPDAAYGSTWIIEHYIKRPQDYRVMEFFVRDAVYRDNLDDIREAQRRIGGDGLVYVRLAKVPIMEMLYYMLGMERFAIDFYENRAEFDSLHAAMLERYEELYQLAAETPVEIILMGDNISHDVIGRARFRDYCLPVYRRLHDVLAGTGKRLAVHMDGKLKGLAPLVADSPVEIVEALTPPPMGDFSVADARVAWPDKALWLNFTSCIHLEPPAVIEAHTRQLLEEAGGKRGFAIGVTEDCQFEVLERSLSVIARVLQEF